jgi:transcriptional regulator with PAS, ATPase and Fis domain
MMQARNELMVGGEVEPEYQGSLKTTLAALEQRLILRELERTKGNLSLASKHLGVSRSGLILKIRGFGMDKILEEIRGRKWNRKEESLSGSSAE